MSVTTEVRLAEGDHVVQFYERDDQLIDVVNSYLAGALLAGDAVVVIATAEHRAALEAALRDADLDPVRLTAERQLTVLDARETLDRFMRGSGPDPIAFDRIVGGLIRGLAVGERAVRAYGEMVAVLWDSGQADAAVELERLWNQLGTTIPLSLFCAYPMRLATSTDSADALAHVCSLHSAVIDGAPMPADEEVTRRFLRTPYASRLARRFVRATLHEWGSDALVDDALIVVSELVTNAVTHAPSDVTVSLSRQKQGVRVTVADGSTAAPTRTESDRDDPTGRGVRVVDALSHARGHEITDSGKHVWVELLEPAS